MVFMIFQLVSDIIQAMRRLFSNWRYIAIAFFAWIIFILLFARLAIFSIPGNDIGFFLEISKSHELLLIFLTTVLMAIVTTMNIKIFRTHLANIKNAGIGLSAIIANIVSLILISATCVACFAALAGAIAAPILFFLFQYRIYAIGFSFILLLVSLHYASQKIIGKCEYCNITHRDGGNADKKKNLKRKKKILRK